MINRPFLVSSTLIIGMHAVLTPAVSAGHLHAHPTANVLNSVGVPGFSLAEDLMAHYSAHRHLFDLEHPMLGHLFNDPEIADKWLAVMETDGLRFENLHHVLWADLQNYLYVREALSQSILPSIPIDPRVFSYDDPPTPATPFDDPPSPVAEPASLILALTALIPLALARAIASVKSRPTPNWPAHPC